MLMYVSFLSPLQIFIWRGSTIWRIFGREEDEDMERKERLSREKTGEIEESYIIIMEDKEHRKREGK